MDGVIKGIHERYLFAMRPPGENTKGIPLQLICLFHFVGTQRTVFAGSSF